MNRPKFLPLLPADNERVGPAAAAVLALVRYRTDVDDEQHGRIRHNGAIWWRASYAEISEQAGLTRDCVIGAIKRLERDKELLVRAGPGTDRTRSYCVASDQSFQ